MNADEQNLDQQLDAQLTSSQTADEFDDEDDDAPDEYFEALDKANDLLKRTAILLEFLSDPNFCKNITARERKVIGKHVDKINELTDEVEALIYEEE